jgi:hypothetical protein
MALTGLNPKESIRYVLEQERGDDNPTVFLLRILSVSEYAAIMGELRIGQLVSGAIPKGADFGKVFLRVLRGGLVGWENFYIALGHSRVKAEFEANEDGTPTDATLDKLLPAWRMELFQAITQAQTPTESEQVKS